MRQQQMGALLIFLFMSTAFSTVSCKPPNIIIFLADDLGWDDVGFHGSLQIKTPNIDALAEDGIVLDNYYTASACTPSRGALLSGVHPIHSSTQNWVINTAEPRGLPLDIKLLPQYLKSAGYLSHAVGKWHLGFYKKVYTPTFRGFDSHVGYWSGAGDYYDHTALEDTTSWGLDFRHNLELIRNASGVYSTTYFTERSLRIIDEHEEDKPLFLYMAYQAVHGANHYKRLQAPKEYIDQFPDIANLDRKTFAGMLLAMDESIGTIFGKLHEKRMLDNSIVIFASDNGGPCAGFSGNAASNWPLRGTKASLWEGGVRVPAFLWSPLLNSSGYVSQHLMHVSDWLPTLLEATGLAEDGESLAAAAPPEKEQRPQAKTPTRPVYGVSMWEALSSNLPTSPRTQVLLNIDPIWNVSAIRVGNYKLIQGLVFPKWAGWYPPLSDEGENSEQQRSVESPGHASPRPEKSLVHKTLVKMGRRVESGKREKIRVWGRVDCGAKPANASTNCRPSFEHCLYDVVSDPCEYNNLAPEKPDIVKDLWARILHLNSTAVPVGRVALDPSSWPPSHGYSWTFWQDEDANA